MTKTTTNLLLMLIAIIAGTYFYVTYCSSCATSSIVQEKEPTEKMESSTVDEVSSYPFAFSNGDYGYSTNDNYNFKVSSSSFLTPISQKVLEGIGSLRSFLDTTSGKVIHITGFYSSDEANTSAFPNLGLARANSIKNHLVENGISSAQINTFGKLMDDMVPDNTVYLGPVSYSIDDTSNDIDVELQALYSTINANPLILYFETGQAAINLSTEQRQKVADISRYLDKVGHATVKVEGHTDNSGDRTTNIALGQERADFAKAYLIKNGIANTRIEATSQGPDAPLESNTTKEGMAKNRRTVVTLKNNEQ